MTIRKFEFHDKQSGWKLNEMSFDNFNLLVGLSGVGKTKILKALNAVRHTALKNPEYVQIANGCEWKLEIITEIGTYSWEAEVQNIEHDLYFIKETIVLNNNIVVIRDKNQFIFSESSLPKLDYAESAISLFKNNDIIEPLYRKLRHLFLSQGANNYYTISSSYTSHIEQMCNKYTTLESLKDAKISLILKAYILQEVYHKIFDYIKEQYSEIFNISDIRIGRLIEFKPNSLSKDQLLTIGLKENGVPNWIINSNPIKEISSGMMKTLLHLFEIALAPKGSVIMIDDFENSMGQNCLPQLTDYILRYSNDIQFILTSHHPYVINNIPTKWWKIVTRKGSEVTVKDADSIPALKTGSKLDKFTLLMNLKEYEEGIQ